MQINSNEFNKDLFNQICDELSENENQQDFTEGTDIGKKYQFDNYGFESLEPQNGVAPSRNVYYEFIFIENERNSQQRYPLETTFHKF